MRVHSLQREQRLAAAPERVFRFFAEARNLERLTPPFLRFSLVSEPPAEIATGTLIRYRLRVRGVPIRWTSRIEQWEPPRRFADLQLRGPYRYWHHLHEFEPDSGGTLIRDTVHYAMRGGPLGEWLRPRLVEPDLERIFDYRSEQVDRIFG
jgi:ligand-binding SRPBCC domain-containing protein